VFVAREVMDDESGESTEFDRCRKQTHTERERERERERETGIRLTERSRELNPDRMRNT